MALTIALHQWFSNCASCKFFKVIARALTFSEIPPKKGTKFDFVKIITSKVKLETCEILKTSVSTIDNQNLGKRVFYKMDIRII